MLYLLVKPALLRRSPGFVASAASLPLVSILGMTWAGPKLGLKR